MTTDLFDQRRVSRKLIDLSGVWRFREAVLDVDESQIITHPEGATRMYERDGIFSSTKARTRRDHSKIAG